MFDCLIIQDLFDWAPSLSWHISGYIHPIGPKYLQFPQEKVLQSPPKSTLGLVIAAALGFSEDPTTSCTSIFGTVLT